MNALRFFRALAYRTPKTSRRISPAQTASLSVESLEDRRLLAANITATFNLADKVLRVEGTEGNDAIQILHQDSTVRVAGQRITVINGQTRTLVSSVSRNQVRSTDVRSLGGHDTIVIASSGTNALPSVVDAGPGDDQVTGGPANDSLVGGDGNDRLFGLGGADTLNGGSGNDYMQGDDPAAISGGNDKLYGGPGNDDMAGCAGNDSLYGEEGLDSLYGNSGNDYMQGDDPSVAPKMDIIFLGTRILRVVRPIYHDVMYGGPGNDDMAGVHGNDSLFGEEGMDSLYGNDGEDYMQGDDPNLAPKMDIIFQGNRILRVMRPIYNDMLSGGPGNDDMAGVHGDDTLLGDAGSDSLYGNDGNDMFLGGYGDGADAFVGGAGSDRFLVPNFTVGLTPTDEDLVRDLEGQDARIRFANGDKAWTNAEIVSTDRGLAWLHQATNNTRLLKLKSGMELTFLRYVSLGGNALADNNSLRVIRFADSAFTTAGYPIDETVLHEIGHNWDDENDKWSSFMALSGWQALPLTSAVPTGFTRATNLSGAAQPWIYRTGTAFSRPDGYGRTNPYEDFATCLETFYSGKNAAANWQAKWNFIQSFLRSLSS